MFHILRHQGFCVQKQPLILLTPKSMLRLSSSFSTVEDLLKKSFQKVIDDPTQPRSAEKIILCMGKLYYELHNARETRKKSHVAIVRVEQLYPFPQKDLQEIFAKYPRKRRYIWVQEEPQNQGAWFYMKEHFSQVEDKILPLEFVGRRSLPLADTGWLSLSWFQQQQNLLIAEALT